MAQEISVTITGAVVKGQFKDQFGGTAVKQDMAGSPKLQGLVMNVGTTSETVAVGDLGTEGIVWMKNLAAPPAGNFVTYGPDSTGQVDFGILNPNEECFFRLDPAAVFKIKADTAAVDVWIKIYED